MKTKREFLAKVSLKPSWFHDKFGIAPPDPMRSSFDETIQYGVERQKRLYECFGDLGMGSPNPDPNSPLAYELYDRRIVIASAYGDVKLTWSGKNVCYWMERKNESVWDDVKSPADVEAINIPDWESLPLVQEIIAKRDELDRSGFPIITNSIPWHKQTWKCPATGETLLFPAFSGFLDMGQFLIGNDFFCCLVEPDLTRSLMDKFFELSVSYHEFMATLFPFEMNAICTFGGDNSCNVSADMYRDYVIPYDMKFVDRYGNLPVNLHSCGPSSHLYDVWTEYPNLDRVVRMQTRGIREAFPKLRQVLPNTLLQITLHPPQFDFENESVENIRDEIRFYAEASECENIQLSALVTTDTDVVARNVRAFHEVVAEINDGAS